MKNTLSQCFLYLSDTAAPFVGFGQMESKANEGSEINDPCYRILTDTASVSPPRSSKTIKCTFAQPIQIQNSN